MEKYKEEFIDFMLESKVLKFGSFTLKSGRHSPFFMNAGAYVTGSQLNRLGEYYARAIHDTYGLDFDVLFGPAYKGIPLAVATVMAISRLYGRDIRYCCNRKEIKDHGDQGILLGSGLHDGDRIVIIEDVTTSGASMAETVPILRAQAKVDILGLMVSLNREEVGQGGEVSALEEIQQRWGFPANAIVRMSEVIEYLSRPVRTDGAADSTADSAAGSSEKPVLDAHMKMALEDYYRQYGVKVDVKDGVNGVSVHA